MKTLALTRETQAALDEIRDSAEPTEVYGFERERCLQVFKDLTEPMIVGSGLVPLRVNQYRWFIRDLAELFRRKAGLDLAYCIEGTLRKWFELGLEPNTMQFLLCEAISRLKQMAEPGPSPRSSRPQGDEVEYGKEEAVHSG